jgi:TLC domain
VTVFPFLVVSVYQQLHFWAVICALTEGSTPFTNFHWFLSKRGKRDTLYFKANLVLMMVTYFAFRVANMWYFFADFVSNFSAVREQTDFVVWATAGFGAFLISMMSFAWFMSLLATAKQVFLGGDERRTRQKRQ